jgi:hypothetical protein
MLCGYTMAWYILRLWIEEMGLQIWKLGAKIFNKQL